MKEKISRISPLAAKKVYRFLRYANERKKFVREIGIRQEQDKLIKELFDSEAKKLIVFFVPGGDWATGKDNISGGVISVVSLCEETASLKDIHGAETIMCTMREDHLLLKHTMFENRTPVFRFDQLQGYFPNVQEILFHVPEYMVPDFIKSLSKSDLTWLKHLKHWQVNIMNQNIRLMPGREVIASLKKFVPEVTITTAHQKYCSPQYREEYGVPLHKFSVWISPEQYQFKKWNDKENLMVVSPDGNPLKETILESLGKIPGLNIQIIRNLTYEQYKALISRAKWSLTFGEGLDAYLIEPVFSGAIGFAIYNEHFFTPDFKSLKTLYPSTEGLQEKIEGDMKLLDNNVDFPVYQDEQFRLCARYYSKEEYKKNIIAFYRRAYTYA